MKILFLSQILPYPLDAGPKVRTYYVLRQLAKSHGVTLVCFRRPEDTSEAVGRVRAWCEAVHTVPFGRPRWRDALALGRSVLTNLPMLVLRDERRAMHSVVARVCASQQFASLHVDQLAMSQFALRAPVGRKILDAHNAMWHVLRREAALERIHWRRALLERESRALCRYEAAVCDGFDRVVTVSQLDRSRLLETGARDNLEVIPICIDSDELGIFECQPGAQEVTYIGGMHWPPNAEGIGWFVREVWPLVEAVVPRARLNVLGKRPPADVRAAQRSSVRVYGYVADPRPVLVRSAVCVVPLLSGGGMRVKILEAWARGLPVVSTTVGAEGLAARDGENLILADSPDQFARAVVALLNDPGWGKWLADSARRQVSASYDWRRVYPRFSKLHEGRAAESVLA